MSLERYEWLMRTITFHDHKAIRTDFLKNRFARMRWFVSEFNNTRKYYRHTEFVAIDEILRSFYTLCNCDFKFYMKDKPANYGLSFRVLANMADPYASLVIPCVTPPINNPHEKENIHDLVMAI